MGEFSRPHRQYGRISGRTGKKGIGKGIKKEFERLEPHEVEVKAGANMREGPFVEADLKWRRKNTSIKG